MPPASTRIGLRSLRLTIYLLALVAVAGADDSEDVTPDPSLPTAPPVLPMLLASSSSVTEVRVHVAERFLPFASRTTVGPYFGSSKDSEEDSDDDDDSGGFHVMFSFQAYAFTPANAATMDCFSIYDDGRAWEKATPDGSQTNVQAFCARRDVPDDSSAYGVAVFRKSDDGPSLVHASRDPTNAVIAEGVLRGWTQPPVVVFRVLRLQMWQKAPKLTLVTNITSVTVQADAVGTIASFCPLDPLGHVTRRIEGGNYYQNTTRGQAVVLCVSYALRSLHDLNGKDKFFTTVRPVELSGWRFNVCPWRSDDVMDVVTHTYTLLSCDDQDDNEICYKYKPLADDDDEDDPSDLTDTNELLKRIWINETEPFGIKRLVIEHHEENAWAFVPHAYDLTQINSF